MRLYTPLAGRVSARRGRANGLTRRDRGLLVRSGRRRRFAHDKLERDDFGSSSCTSRPRYHILLPKIEPLLGPGRDAVWRDLERKADFELQSVHENRIYSLKIHCGPDYPDVPPEVTFISKVNLPCVDPKNGKVFHSSLRVRYHILNLRARSTSQSSPVSRPGNVTLPWRLS